MKVKRTQKHMVLQLTHKEFDALRAALDSVNDGTVDGAYMDVGKLYSNLCSATGQITSNNVWAAPVKKQ